MGPERIWSLDPEEEREREIEIETELCRRVDGEIKIYGDLSMHVVMCAGGWIGRRPRNKLTGRGRSGHGMHGNRQLVRDATSYLVSV